MKAQLDLDQQRRPGNYLETRLVDFVFGERKKDKNDVKPCLTLRCVEMPIQVKDYVWEETEETVLISVPLKGVPANRVDIFSVDDYIKVSRIRYMVQMLLHPQFSYYFL